MSLCTLVAAALVLPVAGPAASPSQEIPCEGSYPKHLQGICTDGRDGLFWCFTDVLVKTDGRGRVLRRVPVESHHGDLCYEGGTLFVAVNLGKFNTPEGKADSWVYEYEPNELRETARHKLPDVIYGAGGMAARGARFFVVGGLPPGIDVNYVYEYDRQFRLVRRHEIASGYTLKGIQTAAFAQGSWWFGCYGDPKVLLKTDEKFGDVERFVFDCSWGITSRADGSLIVAGGKMVRGVGCRAYVVPAEPDPKTGLRVR